MPSDGYCESSVSLRDVMDARISGKPESRSELSVSHRVHASFHRVTMPPKIRIPTVEFRSLLLPPVRVPIRALQTLYRPQCASHVPRSACPTQRLEQRRALNLYKTAKAKTVLGQHKVLTFTPYEYPRLEDLSHKVRFWETTKKGAKEGLIADNISLQELYDNHVKDGEMLWCMDALKKGMAQGYLDNEDQGEASMSVPENLREFSITKAHTFTKPKTKKGKNIGGLKNIILNESSPTEFYRLSLDRAYQFLEHGCPVEFRLRLQGRPLLKEERIMAANPRRWQWMHSHFPHLRPDFIMKGMPKGTAYVIEPVSDGRSVQWVAGNPDAPGHEGLNNRIFKIKGAVAHSVKQGKQAMLPKIMRGKLRESGMDAYSTNTGLPKEQARAKYGKGGKVTYGGEETKYLKRDAETDGFMTPDPALRQSRARARRELNDESQRKMHWEGRGRIGRDLNEQKKAAREKQKAEFEGKYK